MKILTIKPNHFIERQTEQSRFSHTNYSFSELCQLCMYRNIEITNGYREGVLEISIPVYQNGKPMFFTPLRELVPGDNLIGGFEPRIPGESPRKWIGVRGEKSVAKYCKVIAYSSTLLAETNQNDYPPENNVYELITIIAGLDKDEPISPETLMHNYFLSDGGTNTQMTPEEFLSQIEESFTYFKNKIQVIPGGEQ